MHLSIGVPLEWLYLSPLQKKILPSQFNRWLLVSTSKNSITNSVFQKICCWAGLVRARVFSVYGSIILNVEAFASTSWSLAYIFTPTNCNINFYRTRPPIGFGSSLGFEKDVTWKGVTHTIKAVPNDQCGSVRKVLSVRRRRPRFARPPGAFGPTPADSLRSSADRGSSRSAFGRDIKKRDAHNQIWGPHSVPT